MSNPRTQTVLQDARVQSILMRFWSCYDDASDHNAFQNWSESYCNTGCSVMDLHVNHRSGGDTWYSGLLTSCREGNMSMTDCQFLHGLPTFECGPWLVRQEKPMSGNSQCASFKQKTKALRLLTPEKWFERVGKLECQECREQRTRRYRVLPMLKSASSREDAPAGTDPGALR